MNDNNTNWNGEITKGMFDLSQVGTNYQTFKSLTERYLINCLVGNTHLTGNGTLLELFDELMEEVVERGEIAVIELAGKPLLAIPKILSQNLLKEEIEIEFTLLDNLEEKLTSKDIDKYVIFKLNREGSALFSSPPHLLFFFLRKKKGKRGVRGGGLSFWTNRLVNILQKMEKEMFMNEKRLIFFSPSLLTSEWGAKLRLAGSPHVFT